MTETNMSAATDPTQNSMSSTPPKPFRLILHVGAGKTGTSSIQETLRTNQAKLQAQGAWYLGFMLEYSPVVRFPWQIADGFSVLMGLKGEDITNQLVEALDSSLSEIKSRGCHTAIVSNEALFHQIKHIRDVVGILCGKGWSIEIVAYVRRHDAWVKSAYVQWGLMHKSYPGELQTFSQWKKMAPYRFAEVLRGWNSIPEIECNIRNADQAGDVVSDFISLIGLQIEGFAVQRINVQPSIEELLLRSLYNKLSLEEVLPQEFDRIMATRGVDFGVSATSFLKNYLPTEEELKQHLEDCSTDIAEVNQMLTLSGQQPLDTAPRHFISKDVDLGKVVAALMMFLVSQAKKLQHLQSVVNKLNETK